MNSSNIYDRNLFKEQFKDIYNQNRFDFGINNNLLSRIITKWKYTSDKFNKSTVLKNMFDYDNRLILREFRNIILEPEKCSKKPLILEYIIWGNDENIKRIRKSNYLYIDGTFHHPPEYQQLLITVFYNINNI